MTLNAIFIEIQNKKRIQTNKIKGRTKKQTPRTARLSRRLAAGYSSGSSTMVHYVYYFFLLY